MWTRGKVKKEDSLENLEGVYAKYNKIALIINSCTTLAQLKTCEQLVINFHAWCIKSKINPRVYFTLVRFLGEKIKNKTSRLI